MARPRNISTCTRPGLSSLEQSMRAAPAFPTKLRHNPKRSIYSRQVFGVTTDGIRWPGISTDWFKLCCLERFTRLVDKLELMDNNTAVAFSQIFANTWKRGKACGCGAAVALVRVSSMEMSLSQGSGANQDSHHDLRGYQRLLNVQEEGLALLYYTLAATHRIV